MKEHVRRAMLSIFRSGNCTGAKLAHFWKILKTQRKARSVMHLSICNINTSFWNCLSLTNLLSWQIAPRKNAVHMICINSLLELNLSWLELILVRASRTVSELKCSVRMRRSRLIHQDRSDFFKLLSAAVLIQF